MVGNAVHVIPADFLRRLDFANGHHALRQNLFAKVVQLAQGHARPRGLGHRPVGAQHDVVNLLLARRILAANRVGSGDIGAVVLHPRAEVEQQQLAVLQLAVVRAVMQHAAVDAAARDRREGNALRASHADFILKLRLLLIFHASRLKRREHTAQALIRDRNRALKRLDLVLVLHHAHGGQHRMRVLERDGRVLLRKALRLLHVVAIRIAHGVAIAVKIRGLDRFARDAAADEALHAVDIAHIVNAADGLRLVNRHTATRPALHIGNRFFDKQDDMRRMMRIGQHERHVFPAQTRQIEEMMVRLKFKALVHRACDAFAAVKHHHLAELKLIEHAAAALFIWIHRKTLLCTFDLCVLYHSARKSTTPRRSSFILHIYSIFHLFSCEYRLMRSTFCVI